MKRIIQLLLVFLLLVPVNATAQTYTYKGVKFNYTIVNNEYAMITSFDSKAKEVYFPSEIKDKKGNTIPVWSIYLYSKKGTSLSSKIPTYKNTATIVIEPGVKYIN